MISPKMIKYLLKNHQNDFRLFYMYFDETNNIKIIKCIGLICYRDDTSLLLLSINNVNTYENWFDKHTM